LLHLGKVRSTALKISGLLFALGLIAAGCADTDPALTPIRDPTQRLDVPGLSILPPQGDNWFRASFPPPPEELETVSLIWFVKKLQDAPPARPEDARIVFAAVTARDLKGQRFDTPAQFLQFIKGEEKLTGEMVTRRSRLLGHEVVVDESLGATCVRYLRVTEFTGESMQWRFRDALFITASRGFFCLHPDRTRSMTIDVRYDQTYLKGQEPLPLDAEVEPFLKSPMFTATWPVAAVLKPGLWDSQMEAGAKAFDEQRWSDAETAFKAALDEAEKPFKAQDRPFFEADDRLALTLSNLAYVYQKQARLADAEALLRRALAIYEKRPGADQRRYGQTLNDLGFLYLHQGQHEQAEALLRRSLAVREVALGLEDFDVGQSLFNLMNLYYGQSRWAEAEPYARRALPIYERKKGPDDHLVWVILTVLGYTLDRQGKVADAEPLLRRALAIVEKEFGPNYPDVVQNVAPNFAPDLANKLNDYAAVLRKLGQQSKAEELEARARAIREKASRTR